MNNITPEAKPHRVLAILLSATILAHPASAVALTGTEPASAVALTGTEPASAAALTGTEPASAAALTGTEPASPPPVASPPAIGAALPVTYAAFTSSIAAKFYLPGTKMLRQQPIRTYLDRSKPMVALTFDDGPAQYTEHIVDLLKRYNCRATFCMLGNRIKPQADRVRLVAAQGSEIVGHSWDHKSLPGLSKKKIKAELKKTNAAIKAVSGVRPTMYRPPYGAINDKVRKVSKKQRLAILTWSFDSSDWKSRDIAKIFKQIKKNAEDGQIILLHDIHEPTSESVDRILPWLISKGYQPVTVSELMYYKGITIKPGNTYNDGK
ncbi:MAG: polysaccharide deacetylase family protein [Clostridiales Family XIII bacterium]|nr:polysaccharide deacetylase family protein [Clostridiales Family XIII bacterium]